MLYGFQDGNTLLVVAADDKAQYDIFIGGVAALDVGGREPTAIDFMMDSRLAGLRTAWIIDTDSEAAVAALAAQIGCTIEARARAAEKQRVMFEKAEDDPYAHDNPDQRSIEEIYGLDKSDPWDDRTPEEIEAQKQMEEKMKEARKSGGISGDSFAPSSKKKDKARVWEVNAHENADGTIEIDNVLAVKGSITKEPDEKLKAEREAAREARDARKEAGEKKLRPWDAGYERADEDEDEDEDADWSDVTADEFYIAVTTTDMMGDGPTTVVQITPKTFFDAKGFCYDQSLDPFVGHLLPEGMASLMEDAFEFDRVITPEQARSVLLKRGFQESQKLNDFLGRMAENPFVPTGGPILDVDYDALDEVEIDGVPISQGGFGTGLDHIPDWGTGATVTDLEAKAFVFTLTNSSLKAMLPDVLDALFLDTTVITAEGDGWFEVEDALVAAQIAEAFKGTATVTVRVIDYVPEPTGEIIAPGAISVFFRVDMNVPLIEASKIAKLAGLDLKKITMARGFESELGGGWMVCPIERFTTRIIDEVKAVRADLVTEVYGVNAAGERLVPKGAGATVLDPTAEEEPGPRTWNDKAWELDKMTPEEREANDKAIKPSEFIFSGSWDEVKRVCTIYIVPRSYWESNNDLWEGGMPEITRFLPQDLVEIEPGVYETRGRDYNHMTYELSKRGLRESTFLRLWLNNR